MITNARIYLAIAEEALQESQKLEATGKRPKPNGEPGFIVTYDPDQKSFKKALIAVAFATHYLEATFYLAGVQKFGKKYEDIDKKSYEEKLPYFGITDPELVSAVTRLRKTRRDLTHEKAKEIDKMKPEDFRFAQKEADFAVALIKRVAPLLFQKSCE